MSEKYTTEDLVITQKQYEASGIKIGDDVFYANDVCTMFDLEQKGKLVGVDWNNVREPFFIAPKGSTDILWYWSMIMAVKEPEKKIVPFDLSRKEVRNSLRDKWVIMGTNNSNKMFETKIVGFYRDIDLESPYEVLLHGVESGVDAASFLRDFTFLDGSPCGVEVEE